MRDHVRALMVGTGSVGAEASELLERQIEVTSTDVTELPNDVSGYDVIGVATDRPYPAVAEKLDQRCWAAGVPWCEATLVAHEYRVGPVVVPGTTPCYGCWRRRTASQADDTDLYALIELIGRRTVGAWFRGELAELTSQVASMLAAEVAALAVGSYRTARRGQGRFWAGDAVYGALAVHYFSRIGRCARCARPEQSDPGALSALTLGWGGSS